MQILILGGGGFIGSHLTDALLRETDHELVVYDLCDEKLEGVVNHPRLKVLRGDIREDHELMEQLVASCDLVIDLIAHANPSLYVKMPIEVVALNFHENLFIAELCIKYGKRLIQFSTCEVYGKTVVPLVNNRIEEPDDPALAVFSEDTSHMILGPVSKHRWIYSCAKQLLERILHAYGLADQLDYTIVRPFNFIGPRIDYLPTEEDGNPRVFSHFLQALLDGSPMQLVNGGRQRRAYTFIDDAVNCVLRIIENPQGVCHRQIFNIGSPDNELSIRELAEKMKAIYARRWWNGQRPLPPLIEVTGDEFYGPGYDDSDRRIPDITKARQLLGWEPRHPIDEVIERSMEYWCEPRASDFSQPIGTSYVGLRPFPQGLMSAALRWVQGK